MSSGSGGIPCGGKSFLDRHAPCRILPENSASIHSIGTALVSGTQMYVNTLRNRQLPFDAAIQGEKPAHAVAAHSAEKKKNVPFAPTRESIMYGKDKVSTNYANLSAR